VTVPGTVSVVVVATLVTTAVLMPARLIASGVNETSTGSSALLGAVAGDDITFVWAIVACREFQRTPAPIPTARSASAAAPSAIPRSINGRARKTWPSPSQPHHPTPPSPDDRLGPGN